MPKEITTDGVEFGRSYSKRDAAATTRRRHRKPDPRAIAAAHDADHPPQLLHPRPSPTPRTPAPSRSRTRRLPPSAGAARAGPPHPQAPWRSPARRGSVPTASYRRGRRAEKLRRGKRSGHLATAEEEQKKRPPHHCCHREPKQTRSASAAEGAGATQPADESFSGHLGLPTT